MKYLKHKQAEEGKESEIGKRRGEVEVEVREIKNKAQRKVIKRTLDCRIQSLLQTVSALASTNMSFVPHITQKCVSVCACLAASL